MKKGLLSITAGLLISLCASAQYDAALWTVQDSTENVQSLTGLNPSHGFDGTGGAITLAGSCYAKSWVGDALKIDFTNTADLVANGQWSDFSFGFIQWEQITGSNGYKFMKDTTGADRVNDIARAWTVDFSDPANATVTLKVQASAALILRADVGDIAGKSSNGASPRLPVAATAGGCDPADAAKWAEISYSWGGDATASMAVDIMQDWYSGDWWTVRNVSFKDAHNSLDSSKIAKFALTIDDGTTGTVGTKTLYVKDVVIGAAASPSQYAIWVAPGTDITPISGAELKVVDGVIYSAGTITVSNAIGQVISSVQGQLSIASLPAGVYTISAAEGTAKIVK